jgi:hypothetical protein
MKTLLLVILLLVVFGFSESYSAEPQSNTSVSCNEDSVKAAKAFKYYTKQTEKGPLSQTQINNIKKHKYLTESMKDELAEMYYKLHGTQVKEVKNNANSKDGNN